MESVPQASVILAFYEGAYGPTIRIAVREPADLARIRVLFQDLAAQRVCTVALQEYMEVHLCGIGGLTLQVCNTPQSSRKAVFRLDTVTHGDSGESPKFLWAAQPEQWSLYAELIEPLLRELGPGHQYLSEEGVDDALIVLSFRE